MNIANSNSEAAQEDERSSEEEDMCETRLRDASTNYNSGFIRGLMITEGNKQ